MASGQGTKRALCVGINDYPGTGSDLNGCVNDAKDWKAALEARGYVVATLLDGAATRAAIVSKLTQMVVEAKSGDNLVFTYSGHGSWLPDDDGDEPDGRDEMLCPHDIGQNQYLMDDTLAEIFGRKAEGVRLYFVSDSCHSGTVARFAPPLFPDAEKLHPRPRFLHPSTFVKDDAELRRIRRAASAPRATRQKYPALLFAGCRDVEYSYDAVINGRPNGAFTYVALQALKQDPATPQKLMAEVRDHLPTATYPQTPQLYGSRTAKRGPIF
jgi:hypothetical protein